MQTIAEPPLVRVLPADRAVLPDQALQIMEVAFDAMILIDARLRIAAWNSVAEETFGWRADEAIGREIVELVPERLRGTYRLGLPAVMIPASDLPPLRNRFETVAVRSDATRDDIARALYDDRSVVKQLAMRRTMRQPTCRQRPRPSPTPTRRDPLCGMASDAEFDGAS